MSIQKRYYLWPILWIIVLASTNVYAQQIQRSIRQAAHTKAVSQQEARHYLRWLQRVKQNVGQELRRARIAAGLSPFDFQARLINRKLGDEYREVLDRIITNFRSDAASGLLKPHTIQLGHGRTATVFSKGKLAASAILPISGDPITHGHLLVGLNAIASGNVNAVIYRIQGGHPKKTYLGDSRDLRRQLAFDAIRRIPGLFLYYDRQGADLIGEHDFLNFLKQPGQPPLKAYYIASDEYNDYGTPEKPKCLGHLSKQKALAHSLGHQIGVLMPSRNPHGFEPAECPVDFDPLEIVPLPGIGHHLSDKISASAVRLAFDPQKARARDPKLMNKPAARRNILMTPAVVIERIHQIPGEKNPYINVP